MTDSSNGENLSIVTQGSNDPVDKYAPWIVRGSIIGCGVMGAVILTRSLRLFTKFKGARQIPSDFIKRNVQLRGVVDFVTDEGVLQVDHTPISRLPFMKAPKNLEPGLVNVKLSGLEIGQAGQQWLFRNLQSRPVKFTLVHRDSAPDIVDCEVYSTKAYLFSSNVNRELVRRGYARIPGFDNEQHVSQLKSIPEYSRLINRLLISERWADQRGVGIWQRDTWAERFASYPSQFVQVVEGSGSYRATKMVYKNSVSLARKTLDTAVYSYATVKHYSNVTYATVVNMYRWTINFLIAIRLFLLKVYSTVIFPVYDASSRSFRWVLKFLK